jgi:cyclic pyranopterin phosphate synthase
MNQRIIPIIERHIEVSPPLLIEAPTGRVLDTRGRHLADLRISVTDRCNFRCQYCMPRSVFGSDYQFLPQKELLTFEELERLARLFVEHGVRKIRLTGGEPLLRKNLEELVEKLARLVTSDGAPVEVTLTTNGSLLTRKAQSLKDAGLSRGLQRAPGPRRHRCCKPRRAWTFEGQHGGAAWCQRRRGHSAADAFSRHRPRGPIY